MPPSHETPPGDRNRNDEAALGGADAVEKTSYGTGKGAEPEAMKPKGDAAVSNVSAGGGVGAVGWVVLAAVLLAIVAFASGLFR
ncbi:MAG: hypothetical protein NVS4B3_09360 [Gemmatimonadaceae bacterium]